MRNVLILLAALVVAVAVGFVAWSMFAVAPAPAPPVIKPEVKPSADDFAVDERSAGEQHVAMRPEYPFADFADDFAHLRSEAGRVAQLTEHELKRSVDRAILGMKITMRLEDTNAEQVYSLLLPYFEQAGVTLTNMDKPMPEDRFDVFMTDTNVWGIIFHMEDQTDGRVANMLTAEGLCIASPSDCYQWSIDSTKRLHDRHLKEHQRGSLLDTPYRPEFRGADIGGVAKKISGATGVEVIVGPDVWASNKTFTWRGQEVKLREVLERICGQLDASFLVHEERVFIMTR